MLGVSTEILRGTGGDLTGTGLQGGAYWWHWWGWPVCFNGDALQEKIILVLSCGASGIRVFARGAISQQQPLGV